MATRRRPPQPESAARIRHLIALDAENVMKHLAARQDDMVALFSRLRDREPMLASIRSWFETITFPELAVLSPSEQRAVNAFHELLGELRWYLRYTEDMPSTVQQVVAVHRRRLEVGLSRLTAVIGPARGEGGPVVDAEVVEPARPRRAALGGGRRRR